jgi:predicted ArsR family transcriptional regulator
VDQSFAARVSAVAALDEPSRRRLYDHVARQPRPVSRDDAAAALQLPRGTVAFHLDRLVDEGLLDVTYERRTGRSGPGAGRTAKLYQRSGRHVDVSLPERRYEQASRLLAQAVAEADRTGESPGLALRRLARDAGHRLGRLAADSHRSPDRAAVLQVLEEYGYEPRDDHGDVVLANCPFHALAQEQTELICGMNLCLLDGLLDGLETAGLSASLDPQPRRCCVRLSPSDGSGQS